MILYADGFEKAFMGHARRFNIEIAIYDYNKCIGILEKDMTREEAEEFFEFNVVGAWVGEYTPAFLTLEEVCQTQT